MRPSQTTKLFKIAKAEFPCKEKDRWATLSSIRNKRKFCNYSTDVKADASLQRFTLQITSCYHSTLINLISPSNSWEEENINRTIHNDTIVPATLFSLYIDSTDSTLVTCTRPFRMTSNYRLYLSLRTLVHNDEK